MTLPTFSASKWSSHTAWGKKKQNRTAEFSDCIGYHQTSKTKYNHHLQHMGKMPLNSH